MKYKGHESQGKRFAVAILLTSFAMAILPTQGRADTESGQPKGDTTQARAAAGVNGLIAHLHEELKITPAQESAFQQLADVMRENADTMSALAKKRVNAARTVTAVDDLKSYAEISAAHAEGAKKMITAFQPLYDSMSADQKQVADEEFRQHYSTHHHGKP